MATTSASEVLEPTSAVRLNLQLVPSQCSPSVWSTRPAEWVPTAHTSADDRPSTESKWLFSWAMFRPRKAFQQLDDVARVGSRPSGEATATGAAMSIDTTEPTTERNPMVLA